MYQKFFGELYINKQCFLCKLSNYKKVEFQKWHEIQYCLLRILETEKVKQTKIDLLWFTYGSLKRFWHYISQLAGIKTKNLCFFKRHT